MLNKIIQIIRKNKLYSLLVLATILLIIFSQSLTATPQTGISIPFLPKATPSISAITPTPTSILNIAPTNPTQQITFNWGNHNIDQYKRINLYQLTLPLINPTTINKIAASLGFTSEDKQSVLKTNNYRWSNDQHNLFASIPQNQIFYNYTIPPKSGLTPLDNDTVLQTANQTVLNLFGDKVISLLAPNPEIHYYRYFTNAQSESKLTSTTQSGATIYEVSFKQQINSAPVIGLSGTADVITLAFDRNKKLVHLSVYGGIDSFKEVGSLNSITTTDLKETAPTKTKRITAAGSIDFERAFTDAAKLTLNVSKIELGYIQENVSIYPVFLIHVDMIGENLPEASAIYSIPAIP